MSNEYRHFFKSNFLGGNRLFVLVYSSQNGNSKRFKTRRYYLPKVIIKNYTSLSIKKNFYDQPIDSDIKQYEKIWKLTTE